MGRRRVLVSITLFILFIPLLISLVDDVISAVDCGWSEWTSWSSCSRTCDVGIRRRYRSGTNPAPAYGGRACEGERIGLDTCSITPCFGKRDVMNKPPTTNILTVNIYEVEFCFR